MGMNVDTHAYANVDQKQTAKVLNQAEKTQEEPIFKGVANRDLGIIAGTASAITGGLAVMRATDLGVGKSVLKEVANKTDSASMFKRGSALKTLKGSKWQIPLFALASLATGLFAKSCFD